MNNSPSDSIDESTYYLQKDDILRNPPQTWISRLQIWRKTRDGKHQLLTKSTEPSISASTTATNLSDYQSSATLFKNRMGTLEENLRLSQPEIEPLNTKEKDTSVEVAMDEEEAPQSSLWDTFTPFQKFRISSRQIRPFIHRYRWQIVEKVFIEQYLIMVFFFTTVRSFPGVFGNLFYNYLRIFSKKMDTATMTLFQFVCEMKVLWYYTSWTIAELITALAVSWVSMLIGYTSGYTSPADASIRSDFKIGDDEMSWVGSLMPLGAVLGGLLGGPSIEHLGRKWTLLVTDLFFLVAWAVNYFAKSYYYLYISRSIVGIGVGFASLTFPVYLGETIQPEIRGTLGLLPTTLGNIGILLCFLLGMILEWQDLAGIAVLLSIPFFAVFIWIIPETPRWYVSKNRLEDCKKSLEWLRGQKQDITKEFEELVRSQKEQELKNESISDVFTRANLKPLFICLTLMFFQQFTGINAVIFYTTPIFRGSGSTLPANVCTTIIGVVNMLSTFIANALIDKLGRKMLLYVSSSAMAVCLGCLGLYYYFKDILHLDVTEFGFVPLASLIIFALGFSLGFGPIPWLMMGEILPAKIRGPAASVVTAFNWVGTFVITKTFPIMIERLGFCVTFWFYGVMVVMGLVFTVIFVPETRGRSLEDIERLMSGQKVRRMSSTANMKPLPSTF